uniref:Uncharacterized protein n=1 Tax=Picea glauca TaxID=3330 RepID=A0A101LZK4_PICGL|nr:hypothetical protein ABT39_MTgene5114 [Picea glauca]QHR87741.1 hypothetical protein Q903MT_gene1753 [Picea sitchensis]
MQQTPEGRWTNVRNTVSHLTNLVISYGRSTKTSQSAGGMNLDPQLHLIKPRQPYDLKPLLPP